MVKKLPRSAWGFIARYETKIYFEELENAADTQEDENEQVLSVLRDPIVGAYCKLHTSHKKCCFLPSL